MIETRPRFVLRLLAVLVLVLAPAPGDAQEPLTPEQVVSIHAVGAVALSPDGATAAFTVTRPRAEEEERGRSYSELWLTSLAAGASPRVVVERPRSASSPAWSPDGSRLGFIAQLPGSDQRQVYAVPARGGEPRRLTASATGVNAFAWSPGGDRLAYSASVPEDDAPGPGGVESDVVVASRAFRPVRLWVQDLDSGVTGVVTPADLTVRDFVWAPDGRSLAVQLTERPDTDADLMYRDLFRVPLDGGSMEEMGPTPGKVGTMAFSPNSRRLAYLSATSLNDPLSQSVFVVPSAGGDARNLTEGFEGSVIDVDWLDDATLLLTADEGTETVLYSVSPQGGALVRLAGGGPEVFGGPSVASDGDRFAVAASTARHPPELYVGSLDDGTMRRVTHHNAWLEDVALGEQSTVEWEGAEGWRIEGVLIRPVGFREGVRYPLAVLPHGGPEGVSQDGWTTNPLYPAQVLAGEGYVVLMPNYRGSAGRGVEFSKADHRDLGGREFDDVLAGVDHLVDERMVDADRVGISGTSYGGYFSAWAATRHSERFAAAIPFAGLTNWISFTNTTDIPVEMSVVHFDLWWFENPGIYMDRSPISYAIGTSTPTLVGHGLADDRVHPEQSLELHQALKLNDVTTELVLYPREPHGLTERAHQLDFMYRVLDWFGRYLKGEVPISD